MSQGGCTLPMDGLSQHSAVVSVLQQHANAGWLQATGAVMFVQVTLHTVAWCGVETVAGAFILLPAVCAAVTF
jgi:hypothetical protein